MLPTQILSAEHRVIEQVIGCLEAIANRAATTGELAADDARAAIDFFRNFADRCHHGKEEAQLFPMMEERGIPRAGGPIGVMLDEHEQGRAAIRGMAEAITAIERGEGAGALSRYIANARTYAALLREHIQKEDHCLFAMANNVLSAADQDDLLARFERVEAEDMGSGTHERFLELANVLARKYGVALAQIDPAATGCCHHHHH